MSRRAAEPLGEVTVVAPDREQSATSHSLTLHHPVRPIERGERRFQVDGTPTDCVMLAVEALMPERPDFVLSGINHGQNMGEDVLYSGTVAAAMEGISLGIPSIAISFAGGDLRADVSMLNDQIEPLRKLLGHVLAMPAVSREHAAQHQSPAAAEGTTSKAFDSRGWAAECIPIRSSRCRIPGAGRSTGSVADRSSGPARSLPIFARSRKATSRSRRCIST